MSKILFRKRGLGKIIVLVRVYDRRSLNQVLILREYLIDKCTKSVLSSHKTTLQWMKLYEVFKFQFDFALEVWFRIILQTIWTYIRPLLSKQLNRGT